MDFAEIWYVENLQKLTAKAKFDQDQTTLAIILHAYKTVLNTK
jgi:hypothetical protein